MAVRSRRAQSVGLEPNAVVAVDVVLFTVRLEEPIERAWQVLLVKREDAAFAGKWSFPGVLVRAAETFTLPELRSVYAAILDPALLRLNTGNFKKAFSPLFASGVLVPVGRRAAAGRVGRPGDLYRFTGPVLGTWERELPWHDVADAVGGR